MDEVHVVLIAQRLNELRVVGLVAVLRQHTQQGGVLLQSLGCLMQTAGQPVVGQRLLQDLGEICWVTGVYVCG